MGEGVGKAEILGGRLVLGFGKLALGLIEVGDVGEVDGVFPIPKLRDGGRAWGLFGAEKRVGGRGHGSAQLGLAAAARSRKARGAGGRCYLARGLGIASGRVCRVLVGAEGEVREA